MSVRNRFFVFAAAASSCLAPLQAQVTPTTPTPGAPQVTEEMINGVKHQVTRQVVEQRMPVTIMQDRQQTVYTPKVSTETIAHQQVYSVPVTQYEVVPVLHGRWNPFVEPYYTYETQLVTRYQEQVVNVQIPVSKSEWVTETKTVQVPVTEYRTAQQEIITKVALTGGESTKTYASAQPSQPQPVTMKPYNSQPGSSIASQPATPLPNYAQSQSTYGYSQPPYNSIPANSTPATSSPANVASRPGNQSAIGGQMLQTDPPRQGTGWSNLPQNYR